MDHHYGKMLGKLTLAIILMLAGTMFFTVLGNVLTPDSETLGYAWTQLGLLLSAFIMYLWFDRKKGWALGFKDEKAFSSLLTGSIIAILIPTIGAFIMLGMNSVSFEKNNWEVTVIGAQLLLFIVVSVGEEIFFRGYLFGMIKQLTSTWAAIIIPSVLFGLIHLLNPSSLDKPVVHIIIEITSIMLAGILFGLARHYSGSLWLPIGLHLFMNYTQSGVLGFLNGGKDVASLYEITYVNKTIWNGSGFGFESSLLCIPILITAMLVVKLIFNRRVESSLTHIRQTKFGE
ncbi:CPBP family intramembrane glutamic endopeptidase [Metabacillus endolithicus]|uniref:CPBP family intramembrane glutamic endopeptidase n=1 Tax=Metabacillus endolithicus TaxID=1535204 RepID=A0ABW5C129_9BACI|nr:type II CAAX endopeptidase family protein [Metabacillus endolithicus]UPG65187.1 CPBP family intramembrane metalloprotease [Metabacillus endolithicus]